MRGICEGVCEGCMWGFCGGVCEGCVGGSMWGFYVGVLCGGSMWGFYVGFYVGVLCGGSMWGVCGGSMWGFYVGVYVGFYVGVLCGVLCGGCSCTVVKAVEAVDQERQGIRAIGFGQFVAASDAIWRRIKSLVRNKIYSGMQCLQHQKFGIITKYVLDNQINCFLKHSSTSQTHISWKTSKGWFRGTNMFNSYQQCLNLTNVVK